MTGKKIFHPIDISCAYLYRGNVARTRINKKQKKVIFNEKKNIDNHAQLSEKKTGTDHPPQKNVDIRVDINNILLYSPRKNIAKIIDEYSTLYPATSSASASGKSKGVLFVSANIDIKNIIKHGSNGNTNHPVLFCDTTI